ncbi:ATPase ASNA1 homolog 2 [Solanum tuberosum]|uniref:Arsenical pump-driving atpase n=2 Tax=Solanum tuberosum TaxID=4113 RepID=M1AE77_SOLTU|nr:PREDICTED: ATPase ASNA1 homolog 2 [Solanum tuberosum]
MAMASLFHQSSKTHFYFALANVSRRSFSSFSTSFNSRTFKPLFQVRAVTTPTEAFVGFDEMINGTQRKYFMLGGKGGVGKTSCAASLAVKFANHGHPTLIVSTDPAHSLSDSFDQNLTGGALVPVQGVDSPLYALEISPERTREEFRAASQLHGDKGVKNIMDSMGLGMLAEQLGELKLGELLDTPPPGLDEAIAISKVMQFLESKEYSAFSRIVFDTAPTGHTLRLLSLPDFLDASIGKMMKLKKKITSATSALKSMFNKGEPQQDDASDKLEQLRERMAKVRDLFRDSETTEFIIVTIPTVMAINESSRLCASLKKETVSVRKLIVNQILPPSTSECKFCVMRRKDQMRALETITKDPELASLKIIQAPLVDVEIRGVAGLKFMGDMVWK